MSQSMMRHRFRWFAQLRFPLSACPVGFLLMLAGCISADAPRAEDSLVDAYRGDADRLIEAALADSTLYDRLAFFTDTFGPRFSGTAALERAIDWLLVEMEADGLENVAGEQVMVPRWVRGQESLTLLEPRVADMQILGLGGSVGTGVPGITAEVLVVKSFDDLEERSAEARGRIVLFNVPFTTYGETVQYRTSGSVAAARHGAVAGLVRSIGPESMYTPHTGVMRYEDDVERIPHAAVTIEDAMMMQRMQDRGQRVRVRLQMGAQTLPDAESRNVVAELPGTEIPHEVVIMGGHIDSWDVGTGAMDDAGGCLAAWEAVMIMKEMGMAPRRTIRVVCWTNEENGLRGATTYAEEHAHEVEDIVLAIESDSGVFDPIGYGFGGTDEAFSIVARIGSLLESIDAGEIRRGGGGADIGPLMERGVPGMGLIVDGSRYFNYHHTHADMVDKLDPHELNKCVAAMAVMSWVVANMEDKLPRPAHEA